MNSDIRNILLNINNKYKKFKENILDFLPSNVSIIFFLIFWFYILSLIFLSFLYKIWFLNLPIYSIALIQFIISIIVFWIYIFFVWLPIQNILNAIQNLVSWNDFNKIEFKRNDEIWKISHFINQIVKRVEWLSDELHEWKRVKWEVDTAAQIQESTMPDSVPSWIIWLDIIAKTKSSSEIWWDCFDIIQQWRNTLIYLWDVTWHWVPAALIMMMANIAIKTLADWKNNTIEIYKKTNQLLFEKIKTNHFMSSVMLRWDNDKQKIYYTWAWHETIIHFSKETWKAVNIKTWWIAIKMVKNIWPLLKEKEIDFKEWDSLVLYSDWITEAKNSEEKRYWLDHFTEIIQKYWTNSSQVIFDNFTSDYSHFVWQMQQEDDVSFILIKNIWQYWWDPYISIWSSKDNKQWISWTRWSWN